MPKEIIYDTDGPDGERHVELIWVRGQFAQLGTVLSIEGANPGDPAVGQYATLNRAGINKLIRDLRRARDQAFGRDE